VKRLQTALGINLLLSVGLRNPDYATIRQAANIAYGISESGYSRQDELLADYLGAKYIYKSGYDPHASIRALQKLKSEEKGNFTIPFLRSHPQTQERINRLSQKIEEFKTP
jgi:predicted Zn-dependent protease